MHRGSFAELMCIVYEYAYSKVHDNLDKASKFVIATGELSISDYFGC